MAVPPTVPTSFVPRPQNAAPLSRIDLGGAFAFVCYGALLLTVVVALLVFAYDRILAADLAAKDQELTIAVSKIDVATVNSFVRLRDRLALSKQILNSHMAFSTFFNFLEKLTLTNVRFSSLDARFADGKTNITLSGTAKSFNALAAESVAIAGDGRIHDALFSGVKIAPLGGVTFSLMGTLDPKLTLFAPTGALPVTPPATSTASTTP